MNEQIRECWLKAAREDSDPDNWDTQEEFIERFAREIVRECVDQCSQEWYDLNNSSKEELDDRGIAIRVGQKNGVLKVQHRLKKHFGVE